MRGAKVSTTMAGALAEGAAQKLKLKCKSSADLTSLFNRCRTHYCGSWQLNDTNAPEQEKCFTA